MPVPNTQLHTRPATKEDRDAACALLLRANPDQAEAPTPEHWEWLFSESVVKWPRAYLLAERGGHLAGQYATVPLRVQHDGRTVTGLLSLDTATDPQFTRRGIFTALARELYSSTADECPFVFGFPNTNSAPGFYRKLDWVELRPFPIHARALGDFSALDSRLRPLDAIRPLLRLWPRSRPRHRSRYVVESLDHFDAWADALWDELAPLLGTCVIRDAAYLNWRFVQAPRGYRRYLLRREGEPAGFAVTATRRLREARVTYLMELMAHKGDRDGVSALVAHTLSDASDERSTAMVAIATRRHPHLRGLRRAGFIPVPSRLKKDLSFGARLNGSGTIPNQLFHIDDWYISGADLDYV